VKEVFMKRMRMIAALTIVLFGVACGSSSRGDDAPGATAAAREDDSTPVAFTGDDLEKLARGLRKEIDAVKAAQAKAASASTAQERGEAIQAQWDTATIPLGAEASGLPAPRYRSVRNAVDQVFTTLDFQGKIDGPLSIDLDRADAETKARVSGDAFTDLAPEAATALRANMDRLVPLWSEYKQLVAVAG
jgi:hypothetical protein